MSVVKNNSASKLPMNIRIISPYPMTDAFIHKHFEVNTEKIDRIYSAYFYLRNIDEDDNCLCNKNLREIIENDESMQSVSVEVYATPRLADPSDHKSRFMDYIIYIDYYVHMLTPLANFSYEDIVKLHNYELYIIPSGSMLEYFMNIPVSIYDNNHSYMVEEVQPIEYIYLYARPALDNPPLSPCFSDKNIEDIARFMDEYIKNNTENDSKYISPFDRDWELFNRAHS